MLHDPGPGGLHLILSSEVPASIHVAVGATIALPADTQTWLDRVLANTVIVELLSTTATAGWPVTIVHARSADPNDARRTMFAFYELFDRGIVVAMTARDAGHLAAERDAILAFVRAADIDRTRREVVALAQLWETP